MGPRLKDVEDEDRSPGTGIRQSASMGPRLKDVEDDQTAVGYVVEAATLQWGHVSRTWKTPRLPPGSTQLLQRFNGATSQGRGRPAHECRAAVEVVASMGPRLKDVEDP